MNKHQAKHNSEIAPFVVDTIKGRIINPPPELRSEQNILYKLLKSKAEPSIYSFWGYSNALQDLDLFKSKYSYIHLDLESCYEKITYSRVVGLIRQLEIPLPTEWAKICVYEGTLMRGGIPSNYILELILKRLDYRLHGLAHRYQWKYHRYVDDLYFFITKNLHGAKYFIEKVDCIVNEEGFTINNNKTEIIRR